MRRLPTPRKVAEKALGKTRFIRAWLTLLAAIRTGRTTELWIGDSHAMTFNQRVDNAMFMRAPEGQLIVRAGARLMYSLARTGFPPRIMRVVRVVNRYARPGTFVPFFVAGEIDVRAHLVKHSPLDLSFVDPYVEHCMAVAADLKADRVYLVMPPPPCDIPREEAYYPIVGTIQERVEAWQALRDALTAAAARHPIARVLDFSPVLADATGAIPRELTVEGCHTNVVAVRRVRALLAEQLRMAEGA